MTAQPDVPAADTPAGSTHALLISARVAKRATIPSWPWRRGAMLLSGAAQLITIAALTSADRVPATWAMLLLAIAPAPLAAAAAHMPARLARLAAAAAAIVLLAGIIGAVTHTGLFFVPAFAVLVVAIIKMWREPA
jgi:uncharacterized membrane protein